MIRNFFRTLISKTLYRTFLFFIRYPKAIYLILGLFIFSMLLTLTGGKLYQKYADTDPDRGALAMDGGPSKDGKSINPVGALGEKYSTPIYLDQGWNAADSLWFYNTTQGSALLPYDFFMALEKGDTDTGVKLRSSEVMDGFRYLPQKATTFNPDGLPVGFVKDNYSGASWYEFFNTGQDYVGFTCAACHTAQLNYTKPGNDVATAIRIDGGPAMADMVGFLKALEVALYAALEPGDKQNRFVQEVIDLGNNYSDADDVLADISKWYSTIRAYNAINGTDVEYGHARLDAFGRIYNRVLKYVISTDEAEELMASALDDNNDPILTAQQMVELFDDIPDDVILGDVNFARVLDRLYDLNLPQEDMLALRAQVFNEANAPVSYPYLWDIAQSTYVQWNGLANNAALGPLGRNVGEVVGVFGILDWRSHETIWWQPSTWDLRTTLSAWITGQRGKKKYVTFDSSVNSANLQRLERKLTSLQSPEWPRIENYDKAVFESDFGEPWQLDMAKAQKGNLIYNKYCVSCHAVVDRNDADRLLVSNMLNIDHVGTDPQMAENSVNYKGASGNFTNIYAGVERVGNVVVESQAPVIQILTAAAAGVITTPDRDKWFFRRWADWVYNVVGSLVENPIKDSVKAGNYKPDTMTAPYDSLLSYKARPLNGVWATAPYLHNGSIPSLYDMLLPADCENAPDGECRPSSFYVGSRKFDPKRVGIKYKGLDASSGFWEFKTECRLEVATAGGLPLNGPCPGNSNAGHEYGAGKTMQLDGKTTLKALTRDERWELVEYLKTL